MISFRYWLEEKYGRKIDSIESEFSADEADVLYEEYLEEEGIDEE
jgi:hypothetical protein